jgi:hypothetical protein
MSDMRRIGVWLAWVLAIACTSSPSTSSPSPSPTIPDLVGIGFVAAAANLDPALELVRSETSVSTTYPDGTIASQRPKAGTPYDPAQGMRIRVVVTVRPVTVPDVVGMRLPLATAVLAQESLTTRLRKVTCFCAASAGSVLSQRPHAGRAVPPGSRVLILVVRPEPSTLPATATAAAQALFDAWVRHDRSAATRVATPRAVAGLWHTEPSGFTFDGTCEPGRCSFDNDPEYVAFYLVVKARGQGYVVVRADIGTIESA